MASALLRSAARRGSAFRRAVSAAASAAPSGGDRLAVRQTVTLPPSPFRSRLCSGVQGDGPSSSMSPEEKVHKMLQQVKEFDAQYEQDLTEVPHGRTWQFREGPVLLWGEEVQIST